MKVRDAWGGGFGQAQKRIKKRRDAPTAGAPSFTVLVNFAQRKARVPYCNAATKGVSPLKSMSGVSSSVIRIGAARRGEEEGSCTGLHRETQGDKASEKTGGRSRKPLSLLMKRGLVQDSK